MLLKENIASSLNTKRLRRLIAAELDVTEQSVIRYIKDNDNNGPLTTPGVLNIIRSSNPGITDDEILTEANEEADVKTSVEKAVP